MQKLTHHILIIHGIGNAKQGYSNPMQKNIKQIYKKKKPNEELVFHEVLWADLIKEGEAELKQKYRQSNIKQKSRELFIIYISDIACYYQDKVVSQQIKNRLLNPLKKIFSNKAKQDKITIIAHSFGSVIAFELLKDFEKGGKQIDNFFTLGSPLAVFENDYQKDETFFLPLQVRGVWINIFFHRDIIAYPLKNLDSNWDKAVKKDIIINKIFSTLLIHRKYFEKKRVARIITKNLLKEKIMTQKKEKISKKKFEKDVDKASKKLTEDDLKKILEKQEELEEKFKNQSKLQKFFDDFKLMYALMKDYVNGNYKEIPWWSISAVAVTLVYVINPLDIIPDVIPIVGYVDDAAVVAICLKMIHNDLQKYDEWRTKNK